MKYLIVLLGCIILFSCSSEKTKEERVKELFEENPELIKDLKKDIYSFQETSIPKKVLQENIPQQILKIINNHKINQVLSADVNQDKFRDIIMIVDSLEQHFSKLIIFQGDSKNSYKKYNATTWFNNKNISTSLLEIKDYFIIWNRTKENKLNKILKFRFQNSKRNFCLINLENIQSHFFKKEIKTEIKTQINYITQKKKITHLEYHSNKVNLKSTLNQKVKNKLPLLEQLQHHQISNDIKSSKK